MTCFFVTCSYYFLPELEMLALEKKDFVNEGFKEQFFKDFQRGLQALSQALEDSVAQISLLFAKKHTLLFGHANIWKFGHLASSCTSAHCCPISVQYEVVAHTIWQDTKTLI